MIKVRHISYFTLVVLVASIVGFGVYIEKAQEKLDARFALLEQQIAASNVALASSTQALAIATNENIKTAIDNIPKATSTPIKSQDQQFTETIAKLTPSVVSIVVSKDTPQLEIEYVNPFGDNPAYKDLNIRVPVYRQKGTTLKKVGAGTGFIITKSGYIITNQHVVADQTATYTILLSDGTQKNAVVFYRDTATDIAVLKIPGSYTPVTLGKSSTLKLGQAVATMGNALGEYNNSVSVGIISGLNRTIMAADSNGQVEELKGVIQTDAAINPGNSGGPLIDLTGSVVGVNVATVVGSNSISFSIPVDKIKGIIEQVLK